ncbi:MAG: 1,4-dihydroxy-2-naphthoate polyprenyltransferase, partial [Deltaproteobacteria bacterium]|nr:1,4-dihydroxy-2-naphthoate polyprenyltransferase [Deltaproteobacteria bacterium]
MQNHFSAKLSLWIQAARPKTLPAAVAPVVVGSAVAVADGRFLPMPALACLFCAIVLQIAVNLANDYFDFKSNVDSEERLGPVRVTQSGLIPPLEVKRAMILSLFLAALLFLYLVSVGGTVIAVIGGSSILAALAYSGGPYPLASHGLGELFVFIFFGLVAVCSTYFIQAGELSRMAVFAAIPPGLLITAIMVVNNLRDRETDSRAGKNTLAVILGYRWTVRGYTALIVTSYLVPVVMVISGNKSMLICLPLLTLPFGWSLIGEVRGKQGRALN